MKKSKTILTALGLLILIVLDLLLWINAYIDGKYLIEPWQNSLIDETYYIRIDSLSIAMFVNLGIIIMLFIMMIYRKLREKSNNKQ